jgi:hypothetical protein
MRDRRAKQKAEREAASQTTLSSARQARPRKAIPIGRKLLPQEKMWDAQLEAIEARGGNAEWTGAGYREASSRQLAVARSGSNASVRSPSPTPAPAPRSMFAVGGTPGPGLVFQGPGYPLPPDQAAVSTYTHAKQFEANATASINLLAREVADLKRRVGEMEQTATPASRDADMPLWQSFLMALGSGVEAACEAAERDRRRAAQRPAG